MNSTIAQQARGRYADASSALVARAQAFWHSEFVGDAAVPMRMAMFMAVLSVWFQKHAELPQALYYGEVDQFVVAGIIQLFVLPFVIFRKTSRWAILGFMLLFVPSIADAWYRYANHSWLAVWCIPVAALFANWWESADFQKYLRMTLGIVMLGAAAQKLLAGTYLDGSYISFLSYYGSETENLFRFVCSSEAEQFSCGMHKFIGTFIVAWQILVGLLLVMGFRNIIFLVIEIAFLIGAGLYADEMNFQTLNISLLCIAFGVGMRKDLFYLCIALLFIDLHGISEFVSDFLA